MMKIPNKTTTALGAIASLALGTSAHAAVLFTDTFDRPDSMDLNATTTGKSGSLGALDWVAVNSGGGSAIVGNRLKIGDNAAGGGWAIAYVDHNFTDAAITTGGGFTVTVDLGSTTSSGGTRFSGFAVGQSLAEVSGWSANNPASFASDFFFGYDTTGTNEVKVFVNGGTQDYQQSVNLDSGGTLSVTFSSIADFNSGSTVNYEASINGGSVKTGSFTWSGTDENYINLYSNYTTQQGLLDNFEVSAVPEPTTTALLGLGGLALLRRRRK